MDATRLSGPATGATDMAIARAAQISEAIARLDTCAGKLQAVRSSIPEDIYGDLVSQAYIYASFLTDCKAQNMSLKDPRIRELTKEMIMFCEFVEEEY